MKKIFLIFLLFLMSAINTYSDITDSLQLVCIDIIKDPDRIFNLQENYTKYYNSEYIDNRMKDKAYLKTLNKYIDTLFNSDVSSSKMVSRVLNKKEYKYYYYIYVNKDIRDSAEIYKITFWENDVFGLTIDFIKEGNKYYFYDIYKLVNVGM
jgi:hypothetical protein